MGNFVTFGIIFAVLAFLLFQTFRILNEYERAVIFRLGRVIGLKGPGLIILLPVIDRMIKVPLRVVTMDVPPQDIITKDNVSVKVNAVVFFRVMDPLRAIVNIENYLYATSQASQTCLRSILGESHLDVLLSRREEVNVKLQEILDKRTDPWGVKVVSVEIKHVDLPQEMQRAMAKEAEAERERRAKVIHANGEMEAAEKLAGAAEQMQAHPISVQLRFLQTLTEVARDKNSTIIFPVPIDLFTPFLKK